ncbi:hypothetical protein KEM55_004295 [Ascosphaera atra]|nr:hypothetical protein KEM55_004295 [Ascosphaera atra]
MSASKAASSALGACQLHISMYPAPRSLTQSQKVLQAMQKYGEVSAFLNSKYNPTHVGATKTRVTGNTALVIYDNAQGADAAIAASPIMIPLQSTSPSSPMGTTGAAANSSSAKNGMENHIRVTVQTSFHNHQASVRTNPFYNAFQVNTDSMEVQDLLRTRSNDASAPAPAFADSFTARKRRTPVRLQHVVLRDNMRHGATSMFKIWRQGKEERGEPVDPDLGVFQETDVNKEDWYDNDDSATFGRKSAAGRLREEEEKSKLQALGFQVGNLQREEER